METPRESTAAPDAGPDADLQRASAAPLKQSDIVGLTYFDQLQPLLERLHEDGCLRDRAGNRELHYDQDCLLVLLYLFNPTCSSLRALQQASELQNVQKRLGCARASLGSLSEAGTVFDPKRLIEIIQELGGQVQPLARDSRLKDITQTLTLVDATIISAMPRIMAASVMKRQTGKGMIKWRLHTHFEVDRHQPSRLGAVAHWWSWSCPLAPALRREGEGSSLGNLPVLPREFASLTRSPRHDDQSTRTAEDEAPLTLGVCPGTRSELEWFGEMESYGLRWRHVFFGHGNGFTDES